jgi:hypothetical protein
MLILRIENMLEAADRVNGGLEVRTLSEVRTRILLRFETRLVARECAAKTASDAGLLELPATSCPFSTSHISAPKKTIMSTTESIAACSAASCRVSAGAES